MAIQKVIAGDDVGDFAGKYNDLVDKVVTGVSIVGNAVVLTLFDTTTLTSGAIAFPVDSANNGLTKAGTAIKLGGILTGGTTIDASTYNFLVQNGVGAQRLRITNTFAELAGDLELRIQPPSIQAATAIDGQFLKLIDENTGECDYDYIVDTDFTSLSIVGDKVRLTFKDTSFIESGVFAPVNPFASSTKNNILTQTILALNTPKLIAGADVSGVLQDFTNNGLGRHTYTGLTPINVEVNRNSTLYTFSGANQVIRTQIYKNGVAIGAPTTQTQATGVLQSRTTTAIVTLNTGDYIECWVTNESGPNNIIEREMTFSTKRI